MVCHKVEIRLREHTHTHRSQGCFNVCHEVFGCEFDQLWIFPIINLVNDCAFVCVCVWRHTLRHEMRNVSVAIKRNERNKHGVKRKQGSNPIKVRNKRKWTENKGTYHSDGVRSPAGAAICLTRKTYSPVQHMPHTVLVFLFFFFFNTLAHFHDTAHLLHTPRLSARGDILEGFILDVQYVRRSSAQHCPAAACDVLCLLSWMHLMKWLYFLAVWLAEM